MGMVFQLYALPEAEYGKLKKCSTKFGMKRRDADKRLWDKLNHFSSSNPGWTCDTDKSWDMMLACFNHPENRYLEGSLASRSLLGEENLGKSDSIHGVRAKSVPSVAGALEDFDVSKVSEVISSLDPDDVYCVTGDDDVSYVIEHIHVLRNFYDKAAKTERAVVAALAM